MNKSHLEHIFSLVNTFDIGLLKREELIELGITNDEAKPYEKELKNLMRKHLI